MLVEPAPAKINLALHVLRRRADGYHDIETLFAFCRHGDLMEFERADETSLEINGPFGAGLEAQGGNLVLDAVDAFRATFQTKRGYRLRLDKRLPIASGIGGGSADAAATLRLLARYHGIALSNPVLRQCAASLGADVPACLFGRSALGTARGEHLRPIVLAPLPVLLVNPLVAVSTAQAFAGWDGLARGALIDETNVGDPRTDWLVIAAAGRNDLEAPARAIAPEIGSVLDALRAQPGATLARMSGSGATCFALFDAATARAAAARAIAARRPDWWLLESRLA